MASKVDLAISKAVQGSVVSAVICHDCHSVSCNNYQLIYRFYCVLLSFQVVENIEPFFDLSLPICLKSSTEEVSY